MKHLFFVIYKLTFGKTHISLHVENDDCEWAFGHRGIHSYPVGTFDKDDGWKLSRLMSVGLVNDNFSLKALVESMKKDYTKEKYQLIEYNCWVFASSILEKLNIKSKEESMKFIYKISDFEWNTCPYTTLAVYKILNYGYQFYKYGSSYLSSLNIV